MPYITEALSSELGDRDAILALARWPAPEFADDRAANDINWLIDLVSAIRSVRSEMNVPAAARTPLVVVGAAPEAMAPFRSHAAAIEQLARVDGISEAKAVPRGSAQIVVAGLTAALPLNDIVDFAAERARLEKEIARVQGEIARIDKKLANAQFVERAPEDVVETEREKRAAYAADGERLSAALQRVRAA
jgi:valyl-tRNA synthetase